MENSEIIKDDSFLDALIRLVTALRGKNGCPWDKKQTPDSVSAYVIEEVYELVEAIAKDEPEEIREELGDVLFHIVFLARMFHEKGQFNLEDVAEGITRKMIRRHPHVFGERVVSGREEVIRNWHQIKQDEKQSFRKSAIFESVPANMPSLMRAYRILDRAAKSGIEYGEMPGNVSCAQELPDKLKQVLNRRDNDRQSEDFGQLLLALINFCRRDGIHPETALAAAIGQFETRVKRMLDLMDDRRQEVEDLSTEQKAEIWSEISNHS